MERINQIMEFLAANPDDSFLKHALALEYIKKEDDAQARKLFEDLLQNDPAYVGSYYHLAKLLQRNGDLQLAGDWYRKGIEAAKAAGDLHSLNELQVAYEDMLD